MWSTSMRSGSTCMRRRRSTILHRVRAFPYQASENKRYIGKIVFLAGVARPRVDLGRKEHFDGKLGIWPVVDVVPAASSSRHRLAGTPETKNVSMDKTHFTAFLINQVFPAIQANCPCKCFFSTLYRLLII
jgi:hypothetical protein